MACYAEKVDTRANDFRECASNPDNSGDWTLDDTFDNDDDDHAIVNDVEDHAHPQIAVEGAKQFLLYQADIVIGATTRRRVFLTERCGTATWWGDPELVYDPGEVTDQVVIEVGRPNIALNRADNVVHVAFIVVGDTTSTLYWARRTYAECP